MQHQPPPSSSSVVQNPYTPHYTYDTTTQYYTDPNLNPPGVDPYASASAATSAQTHGDYYAAAYAHQQQANVDATSAAGYYHPDPNAVVQDWSFTYASAAGVAATTNGTEQSVPAPVNSRSWTNVAPRKNYKKTNPHKPKVLVQSVWCEVCKISCNTKDVLDVHKTGKKHKKNLEKLKAALAPAPVAVVVPNNPVIGPQEKPKKRKAKQEEDLNTKKKKILEGGAAQDAVRTCDICNVVCNSELVYKYHLAGQKHAANVKKRGVSAIKATAT